MKRIDAWETTDGKVFKAKDDAGSHQFELDFKEAIHRVCGRHCFSGMTQENVEDMIWEERFELLGVLRRCDSM